MKSLYKQHSINSVFKNNKCIKKIFQYNNSETPTSNFLKKYNLEVPLNNETEDEVPYISSYYFKNKVNIGEDIIMPIYLTDYYQKDYLYDITTERFAVKYSINGEYHLKENIPAGDYNLNLGSCNVEGEVICTIQVIDSLGRRSQELFKWILVVNPSTYPITTEQTYNVTSLDLNNHSIIPNAQTIEQAKANRLGIQALLNEIKINGYRKAILLQDIYKIDHGDNNNRENIISIPTQFTLDLNGSTIKLFYVDTVIPCRMMEIKNCFDSHVTNGTFEGDFIERQTNGTLEGWDSEGMNCFSITGDSKFSSFNNLTIKHITGYGCATSGGSYTENRRIIIADFCNTFTPNSTINYNTGEEIYSISKSTSAFLDLIPMLVDDNRDICFWNHSYYGGLMGANDFNLIFSYYDENYNFIGSVNTSMYRKSLIKNNAKYLKLTVQHPNYTVTDRMYQLLNMPVPICCSFNNIHAIETRTCAFNPNQCLDFDLSDILMTRCAHDAWSSNPTPIPIDIEDGWFTTNDFYFRNVNIDEKSPNSSGGVIVRTGFNITFDNCNNLGELILGNQGSTIRNCNKLTARIDNKSKVLNGYARVYNNTDISGGITNNDTNLMIVRNCETINGASTNGVFKNCIFIYEETFKDTFDSGYGHLAFTNVSLYDCTIKGMNSTSYRIDGTNAYNCIFINNSNFDLINSGINFYGCNIDNTEMRGTASITLDYCKINNLSNFMPTWYTSECLVEFNNCIINNSKNLIYGKLDDRTIEINDCDTTLTGTNTLLNNTSITNNLIIKLNNSKFNLSTYLISGRIGESTGTTVNITNGNSIFLNLNIVDQSLIDSGKVVIN